MLSGVLAQDSCSFCGFCSRICGHMEPTPQKAPRRGRKSAASVALAARGALAVLDAQGSDAGLPTVLGVRLSLKEEQFCQAVAKLRNRSAAYREVYAESEHTLPQSVWAAASVIFNRPHVEQRVRELERASLGTTLLDVRDLIQRDIDVAMADPSELVKYLQRNCRYCHGVGFAYQWVDEAEYMAAWCAAVDAAAVFGTLTPKQRNGATTPPALPSDAGGYGYARARQPEITCPHCLGVGESETVITDTTKLSGKAAKLFKGIKQTTSGPEVLMHDQQAALERLARYAGLLKDGPTMQELVAAAVTAGAGGAAVSKVLPEGVTQERAASEYLRLVG
jgi:phage terminase small subunit